MDNHLPRFPNNPLLLLRGAIKSVPAVKYASGIVGIAAAVAIVLGIIRDPKIAFFGIAIMLALMFILVIFAYASKDIPGIRWIAALLAWGIAILFIGTLIAVFTSFVFGVPKTFAQYLTGSNTQSVTPNPVTPQGFLLVVPPAVKFRGEPDPNLAGGKASPEQVDEAEREVQRRGGDPKTLNDAGVVIAAAGNRERAQELLQEASRLAPQDPTITYNLARLLYKSGQVDEAFSKLQQSLNGQPQFVEAQVFLASIYAAKQDFYTAEEVLRKILEENPNRADALIVQGVIHTQHGKIDDAIQSFEHARNSDPNNSIALYNLGVIYQQQNDMAKAEQFYRQAIEKDPELAEAYNNLGTILAQQGKADESFEAFHRAAELKPDDPVLTGNLSATVHSSKESVDKLAGEWVLQGGSRRISGTAKGQRLSQSFPMPGGFQVTISKVGNNEYRMNQMLPTGATMSTVVRHQPDGSYRGPAAAIPGLPIPAGVSVSGTVTFWMRGDVLFGDTRGTTSGPGISLKEGASWKAHRKP